MILTFILPFLLKEWRVLVGIALIGGLYYAIFTHGYNTCENEVAIAAAKAAQQAQIEDAKKLKVIQDSHQAELTKHLALEGKLTNEINKKQYRGCSLSPNGVRLLNKFAK